jgi:carboxypeptidase Q
MPVPPPAPVSAGATPGASTSAAAAPSSGAINPFGPTQPAEPRPIPARLPSAVVNGVDVPPPAIAMGDPRTVRRIIDIGQNDNRVMEHLTILSRDIGPRLTGSERAERANRWTVDVFQAWGLTAQLQQWGTAATRFDRGAMSGRMLLPEQRRGDGGTTETTWKPAREFELTTLSWSRGTSGAVRGPVVRMPETEDEYAKVKDSLRGAWLLIKPQPIGGRQGVRAAGSRSSERFNARKDARAKVAAGEPASGLAIEERVMFDGIAGFVATSRDERVWTTSIPKWRELEVSEIIPDVEVTVRLSDYDAMNSRLTDGETVWAEFDLPATLTPGPIPLYNTIGEIRGVEKPDEVVILCAHMDSWDGPGSVGTIDNGTGVATVLEAARLLVAAGARPRRTIRFVLFTGEEQGLLGARAYVKELEAAGQLASISAAFNEDGGTNFQGGLRPTADMADLLAAATAPVNYRFTDSANGAPLVTNIKVQESFPTFASSDHYAFVERGVPGFYFDETGRADYGRGWHTQYDRLDLAIPEYLAQSATLSAVLVYNIACAPELLPRLPDRPKR